MRTWTDLSAMAAVDSAGTAVLDPVIETTEVPAGTDQGDHDLFAHFVAKHKIVESRLTGQPVIALCGKVWVPRKPDAKAFPVCPTCKEIFDSLKGT